MLAPPVTLFGQNHLLRPPLSDLLSPTCFAICAQVPSRYQTTHQKINNPEINANKRRSYDTRPTTFTTTCHSLPRVHLGAGPPQLPSDKRIDLPPLARRDCVLQKRPAVLLALLPLGCRSEPSPSREFPLLEPRVRPPFLSVQSIKLLEKAA